MAVLKYSDFEKTFNNLKKSIHKSINKILNLKHKKIVNINLKKHILFIFYCISNPFSFSYIFCCLLTTKIFFIFKITPIFPTLVITF